MCLMFSNITSISKEGLTTSMNHTNWPWSMTLYGRAKATCVSNYTRSVVDLSVMLDETVVKITATEIYWQASDIKTSLFHANEEWKQYIADPEWYCVTYQYKDTFFITNLVLKCVSNIVLFNIITYKRSEFNRAIYIFVSESVFAVTFVEQEKQE
jgi:hypothetical protein